MTRYNGIDSEFYKEQEKLYTIENLFDINKGVDLNIVNQSLVSIDLKNESNEKAEAILLLAHCKLIKDSWVNGFYLQKNKRQQ